LRQLYLICNKELAFNTYECNIFEKSKPKPNKIIRKIYNRVYNSNNTKTLSQLQINKLKECDEYFGYYSDINRIFQIYLYSKCHSKFYKLKKNIKKVKNNSILFESNLDSCDFLISLLIFPISSTSLISLTSPTS